VGDDLHLRTDEGLQGFTEIYLSPVTLFFLTLFFLNLGTVIFDRIPLILRRALISDREGAMAWTADSLERSGRCRRLELPTGLDGAAVPGLLRDFFRKNFWYVLQGESPPRVLAVRHRLSAFGFLLFHLTTVKPFQNAKKLWLGDTVTLGPA